MPDSSSTPSTAKPSPAKSPSGSPKNRRWNIGATVAVVIGIVAALYVANRPEPIDDGPLVPVFEHVESQGYTANRSLAGRYRPGDVVQIAAPEPLTTPILALRGEVCFPDLEPSRAPFPLPEDAATREASFGLDAAQVEKVLPGLAFDDAAASGYRLLFERPEVLTIPKLEMSGRFSPQCVAALDAAGAAGDELQWYATVHEVVVAAGMLFEVTWERGTSADARASIGQRTEKALENAAVGARSEEAVVAAGQVRMEASDSRHTVWRVEAPVVLGYRTRPMEPQTPAAALGTPGGTTLATELAVAVLAAAEEDPRKAFAADSEDFVGRLAIRVQTEEGRWERVGTEHEFQTGNRFRFEAESSRPARLFVFHQPPGGERAELWPGGRDDPSRVERGRPVTVPAPPAAFEMQDDTGLETFFVALADVEAEERERLEGAALGNYVLRGLGEARARGVGIVDDAEPWLYFRPEETSGYLATIGFQLRHGASD